MFQDGSAKNTDGSKQVFQDGSAKNTDGSTGVSGWLVSKNTDGSTRCFRMAVQQTHLRDRKVFQDG